MARSAHLADAVAGARAARRAGDAQGLHRRSLPGVRGARRGRGRRARHPAHAAARAELARCSSAPAQLGLFVLLEAFDDAGHRADARDRRVRAGVARSCWSASTAAISTTLQVVPRPPRRACRAACRGSCRAWPRAASTRRPMRARLRAAGYALALVGSALMQRRDPQALAREMLAGGAAAPARRVSTVWIKICGMTTRMRSRRR